MQEQATKKELKERLDRFYKVMNASCPDFDTAIFMSKVNQYYFTGTMQDGMLLLKKDGSSFYFVRRSFERAKEESVFENIYSMETYGDAAAIVGEELGNTYLETETVTVGILDRLKRKFKIARTGSLDRAILSLRAVKTPYEIAWMERAGAQHHRFLTESAPTLMHEGISEAEFAAALYPEMVRLGHQGFCRFSMFQNELVVGQIGFGESSLYPTNFDGPGGSTGISPAAPFLGSRERKLKKGDLVFIDIGYAQNGYNSDKTQVYMFGKEPSDTVKRVHRFCMETEKRIAEMMKPGALPADIYNTIMDGMDVEQQKDFMGFGSRQVKFLGHGVGLNVDEMPLIAGGYKIPLEAGMAIALEPKKGIRGVGMVGVEDTYIVESGGARCITGGGCDIIVV